MMMHRNCPFRSYLPAGRQAPRSRQAPSPKVIRVTAERFAFTPSEIVVERGTVIEFHLTSDDTDHGFRIVGTDVNAEIPKRRRGETVVKYVADTAGRVRDRVFAALWRRPHGDARDAGGQVRAAFAKASARQGGPDGWRRSSSSSPRCACSAQAPIVTGDPLPGITPTEFQEFRHRPRRLPRSGGSGRRPRSVVQRHRLRGLPQRAGHRRQQPDDRIARRFPRRVGPLSRGRRHHACFRCFRCPIIAARR